MSDQKTVVVFGAGPGLGFGVAERFGREGYRVALVARRQERLDAMVSELAGKGIDAAGFSADLSASDDAAALVQKIRDKFGRIDVITYAPVSANAIVQSSTITTEMLRPMEALYFHTLVEIVGAVLPEMIERRDGAIFFAFGASVVDATFLPGLSGFNTVSAATRHWIHALNGELADKGIYAGTLSISAMIENSDAYESVTGAPSAFSSHPVVEPLVLPDLLWNMLTTRDKTEMVYPAPAQE